MKLWLLLVLALIVQEGTSTAILLAEAYKDGYPLLFVHLLWIVLTIAQIYAAYYFGKWIQRRAGSARIQKWMQKQAENLEKRIGKRGERAAIVIGTILLCPILVALAASWLDISITTVALYTFLGDVVWYASEWATAIGGAQLLSSVHILL